MLRTMVLCSVPPCSALFRHALRCSALLCSVDMHMFPPAYYMHKGRRVCVCACAGTCRTTSLSLSLCMSALYTYRQNTLASTHAHTHTARTGVNIYSSTADWQNSLCHQASAVMTQNSIFGSMMKRTLKIFQFSGMPAILSLT